MLDQIGLGVNRLSPDLEELFFRLPRNHRDCLEYLGRKALATRGDMGLHRCHPC